MDNKEFVEYLIKLGACHVAVLWVADHGGTADECWRDCQRNDWMGWLLRRIPGIRHQLVGTLVECIELLLPEFEINHPESTQVRKCTDECKKYAAKKISKKELNSAALAASNVSFCINGDTVNSWVARAAYYASDGLSLLPEIPVSLELHHKFTHIFHKRFPTISQFLRRSK